MASSVEQIKAKLSIVEVVSSYLKLEKAGINYRGRCPFHNEKTPSFFVSPIRGSYHCFGCHRGGDVISFVQEIEGLDFIETIRLLADRTGIKLENFRPDNNTINNRLFNLLETATNFYVQQLNNNQPVLDYLLNRGLNKETIKQFRLGFAPDAWRDAYNYLIKQGYREQEMIETGLVVLNTSSGSPRASRGYDRFRSRLMFPVADSSGRIVGFSGRIWGTETETQAKYINTPQTELYNKSKILYGYDRAKRFLRQKDECVFVEGQFDLIMSHQAGVVNTVAVSGTALTEDHIRLVKRLTDNIILAYDYDLAGLKASWRAINLIRQEEINVKIAKLPSGQDPADFIKDNPTGWPKIIAEAKHYIDFMIDALQEEGKTGLDLNLAVNNYVLPYIKVLDKKMEQAHFIAKLADLLKITEEAIWLDLRKVTIEETISNSSPIKPIKPDTINRQEMIENKILGLYFLTTDEKQQKKMLTQLFEIWGESTTTDKITDRQKDKESLILSAELRRDPQVDFWLEFEELIDSWREESLKSELKQAFIDVRIAERNRDDKKLEISLRKCQELSIAINKLKK